MLKGLVAAATLFFIFILSFSVRYVYNHIHTGTVHLSLYISRGLSSFLHFFLLRGENFPVVACRDLYPGLPYIRQAHFQLSYAAPFLSYDTPLRMYAALF
jgi:hypothetical protein